MCFYNIAPLKVPAMTAYHSLVPLMHWGLIVLPRGSLYFHTCVTMVMLQVYQQSIIHVTVTSRDIPYYAVGDCALQSSGDPQPVHGAAN